MKDGTILIKGGRVVDPANKIDEELDVLVEGGKIAKVAKGLKGDSPLRPADGGVIDAKGLIVAPGLIDMHTHLRQPGEEDKETLLTASKAALHGGFTSICAMPNTHPACDNEGVVEYLYSENRKIGLVNIFPFGAITKNLEGKELTEMGELRRAGAVAVTDDGKWVASSQVMRRALEYAKMFNLVVVSHCEDPDLTNGGVMNEGRISTLLGLKGMPQASESAAVARDISLAKLTGGKLHIMHISTKDSVEFIRKAKKDNLRVTCEVTPHHFTLTEEALKGFNTNAKMNPPLRTKEDVDAVKEAFKDGIIDVIATDHAPHAQCDKEAEFDYAPFGIIGLETALSLAIMELVNKKFLSLSRLIEKMSLNPAKILGLEGKGSLGVGCDADMVIFDPEGEWVFEKNKIQSKSKNSPFVGMKMKGRVEHVIVGGKKVL